MRSSRYAPSAEPQRRRRPEIKRLIHQSRFAKPPKEPSAALRKMRFRWYASNPWRRDWDANFAALRGARSCFLERGSA